MAGRLIGDFSNPKQIAGTWPSVHDLQVPLIKDSRNIIFTDMGIRKMPGWRAPTAFTNTSAPIRGMVQTLTSGTASIFYATTTDIFKYEDGSASAQSIASGFTGLVDQTSSTAATQWSFAPWGNWVLATNGQNAPQIWKGGSFSNLTTSGQFTVAEILVRRGNYILAFNVATAGGRTINKFHWCHTDDVEQWSPTVSNAAGSLFIRDMSGEIIAGVPLGDRIAVYGANSMHLVSYLGPPLYHGVARAVDGVGAISKNCVVSVGQLNYGVSIQGFWVCDGASFRWIDDPAVRNFFQNRVTIAQKTKIVAYHDKILQQVIWYYPSNSSTTVNEGLGYDYVRGVWTIYDHGRSSVAEQTVFNTAATGTEDGHLYFHGFGKNADTQVLPCYLETAKMSLGQPENFKEVLEVYTGVHELTGALTLRIAGLLDLEASASYSNPFAVSAAQTRINVRTMGRFIQLRYESTATNGDFIISSIRLKGEYKGTD
jgi:hypothetical protein